jgi:hypothetical protein
MPHLTSRYYIDIWWCKVAVMSVIQLQVSPLAKSYSSDVPYGEVVMWLVARCTHVSHDTIASGSCIYERVTSGIVRLF